MPDLENFELSKEEEPDQEQGEEESFTFEEGELTPEEIKEQLRENPEFLPTHKEVTKAFKNIEEWNEFCFNEEDPVFEFFNEEYLNALTDYFEGRIQELGASEDKPLVVLEIGAGNGKLSHFLNQKLEEKIPGQVQVIATDSGERGVEDHFSVEQLKHDEAMEQYSPDVVLCSWMPVKEDFSKDIREFDSVQEYILIGESDGGCCGDDWKTWGCDFPVFSNKNEEELSSHQKDTFKFLDENGEELLPYEQDGFYREDLDDLSDWQICRTDIPGDYYHSKTVSFRKKGGNNVR